MQEKRVRWRPLFVIVIGIAVLVSLLNSGGLFSQKSSLTATLGSSSAEPRIPSATTIIKTVERSTPDVTQSSLRMAVGEPAFDFALYDLDGKFVWLSDLKGKIVIISFWATWCPPCLTEIPDLISAYPDLQARGIEILAVDIGEAADVVYRTSRELGMTFPVLLDSSTQLSFAYGLKAIPSSYFIDRDGVLRHIQIGPLTPPALEEILASIE